MNAKIQEVKDHTKAFIHTKAGKVATAASVAASTMIPMASASGIEAPAASLDTVIASTSTLTSLMTSVWNMMVSNPLLVLFLASALIGLGIKLFKKVKGASGGSGS